MTMTCTTCGVLCGSWNDLLRHREVEHHKSQDVKVVSVKADA